MPLAPRSSANGAKMKTTLSTWTPLNHPVSNTKVFEERRNLLSKWFDRWSDSQRRAVLQDFVKGCSSEQLMFLSFSVSGRLPLQAADFTCLLPRALCLYLFSFLDPRSLCRCAQVSWHWRSMVELDQLWIPKCLRLGWCISFSPTPFEQGVWKRHYIHTVQKLRLTLLQRSTVSGGREELSDVGEHLASSTLPLGGISSRNQLTRAPPWRDSDRHPKDTLRFNYLDNVDTNEQSVKGQMDARASTCSSNMWKSDRGIKTTLSETNYKLHKAKSLMFLNSNRRLQRPPPPPPPHHHHHHHHHETSTRPVWASPSPHHPITKETTSRMLQVSEWNAGIHPGPMRLAVPQLSVEALKASRRSHRSAPSKKSQLFPSSGLNMM